MPAWSIAELKMRDLSQESTHLASVFHLTARHLKRCEERMMVRLDIISCRLCEVLCWCDKDAKASVAWVLYHLVLSYCNEEI